jgi:hypothetical protein
MKTMKRCFFGVLVTAMALAVAAPAYAQGGGASATGTIQGRVSDAQGAVLPGVTVVATSPALLGAQTTVTSETGNYRFPAVPPGTYTVVYELPGFGTVRREGIQISLGFTANINVEMALATLQETVTVTGESPVIDTSATRVVQNFKLEQLQSIPNGRDMWSLLAVTPAVQMTRIDVGGNRAGTQTGYSAYGLTGQVRVLIEGINTTEGTGGAGFYFDYSSLEEVFLGTSGQSAEMPSPGVQSQFIAKSGGNQFNGEYYLDWYNNSLQGSNIPDAVIARGIRPHSNEIDHYYDTAINAGGPVKRDRVWWFGTYRTQKNAVAQPQFQFDKTFDTKLWNPVAKGTFQATQNHKIIGYYQYGQKIQPNRLPYATYIYTSENTTNRQDSGSWVYKGEWNGTLSDKLYVEARYGDFGYYFPLISNGNEDYFWRDTGLQVLTGSQQRWQLDRDRKQLTGAATYFLDTTRGSHTLKFGGEMLREQSWEGYEQQFGGHVDHQYANNVPSTVVFALPTATAIGHRGAGPGGDLTSRAALNHNSFFVNDTWSAGRMTVNGGVRYDNYRGWLPEQEQLAATVGPVSVPAATFAQVDHFSWHLFAPRLGLIYDLTGDGRTVLKGNYGFFWHNPGAGLSSSANPNTTAKSETYQWNDLNGDRRWQPGEQGSRTASSLQGTISLDPNIKAPYSHEASVWLERQVTSVMGVRTGFVYKTEDDLTGTFVPGRSALNNAYSVAFPFTDVGADGVRGTSDDRQLTLYGMPSALQGQFPVNSLVMNVPDRYSRYRTFEAALTKRYGNRWSAQLGGAFTWMQDNPETVANSFPQTPDRPGVVDRTMWNFKVTGSYDAPWGIRLSPVLRHQSGTNFARQISVPASAGNAFGLIFPASTIYADDANANREDNIWVFDVRAEKTVNMTDRIRTRLFFDLFNLTNSSASETITRTTGANFLRPANILAPVTARVGFRFLW